MSTHDNNENTQLNNNGVLNTNSIDKNKQHSDTKYETDDYSTLKKLSAIETKKYQNIYSNIEDKLLIKSDMEKSENSIKQLVSRINIISRGFSDNDNDNKEIFTVIETQIINSDPFSQKEWLSYTTEVELGCTPFRDYVDHFISRLNARVKDVNDIGFKNFENDKLALIQQAHVVLKLRAKNEKLGVAELHEALDLILTTNFKRISKLLKTSNKPKKKQKTESK